MLDYHIHTKYCHHAIGDMENYVKSAIEMDLKEIGFSCHYPMFFLPTSILSVCYNKYCMKLEELPSYFSTIDHLRDKYRHLIDIKTGIEIDYLKSKENILINEINKHDFDYIIGSIHVVDGWVIDDENNIHRYDDYDPIDLYSKYFIELQNLCKSELFDIVGHFDLIKKFNYIPNQNDYYLINDTLEMIKKHDLCLEINTSGIDRPINEFYPSPSLFGALFDLNIPITLGSDAHRPNQVGRYFKNAIELLKKSGYENIASFTKRKKKLIKIQ